MKVGDVCRRAAHCVSLVGITLQVYVLLILLPFTWHRASAMGLADVIVGWDHPSHGPWNWNGELSFYLHHVFLWSFVGSALMLVALLLDRVYWRLLAFVLSAGVFWGLLLTHFWLID